MHTSLSILFREDVPLPSPTRLRRTGKYSYGRRGLGSGLCCTHISGQGWFVAHYYRNDIMRHDELLFKVQYPMYIKIRVQWTIHKMGILNNMTIIK